MYNQMNAGIMGQARIIEASHCIVTLHNKCLDMYMHANQVASHMVISLYSSHRV